MAERRMFAKTIVTSDAFLDMPLSARCLYFALGMYADDEGFVNNSKSLIRLIGASPDDMNVLILRKFIISFDSGVQLIKHWRINNYLRSDRLQQTKYIKERQLVALEENGTYTLIEEKTSNGLSIMVGKRLTNGRQAVDERETSGIPSIGENIGDKLSTDKESIGECKHDDAPLASNRFVKPTLEEVTAYCNERNNNINAQRFIDYYESNGWKVGKNPMRDWKASVRTWESREKHVGSCDTPSKYDREE